MKTRDLRPIKKGMTVFCTKCANLRQGTITVVGAAQPQKSDYTVCAVQWSYSRESYWLTANEVGELYESEVLAISDIISQLHEVAKSTSERIKELNFRCEELEAKRLSGL